MENMCLYLCQVFYIYRSHADCHICLHTQYRFTSISSQNRAALCGEGGWEQAYLHVMPNVGLGEGYGQMSRAGFAL